MRFWLGKCKNSHILFQFMFSFSRFDIFPENFDIAEHNLFD